MIKIVNGNILEAKEDIIGHQCNAKGVMGSGLAKQLRDSLHYNFAYEKYIDLCSYTSPQVLLGMCQIVECHSKIVANLFGQFDYGRDKNIVYTNYEALFSALKQLSSYARFHRKAVALPYNIGCGLANGNWDEVYPMLDLLFDEYYEGTSLTLYKWEG